MRKSVLTASAFALAVIASAIVATDVRAGPIPPSLIEQGTIAPMLERVLPAIVSIRVKGLNPVRQNPLATNPLLGRQVAEETSKPNMLEFTSSGSGVIVDAGRGLVVTNFHVIEKATEIKVQLSDGREYDGRLLGRDAATDVAVLQIPTAELTALPFCELSRVRGGDFVIAIGSPYGLDSTATFGMVSMTARSTVGYREFESYIQHDAAVNSGNSGGALVNLRGELVGINTAILSPTGGNVGLGFAIPIEMIWYVTNQIEKHGKVRRGISGIKTESLTPSRSRELGLARSQGARVYRVQAGSPAEVAGVRIGDVVVAANERPVRRATDFATLEAMTDIGDTLVVEVERDGRKLDVRLAIADIKSEQERLEVPASIFRLSGVVVGTLESGAALFGEVRGVEVLEVKKGTFAELVGLLPGDIITAIDQDRVRTLADIVRLSKDRNTKYDIQVVRNGVPGIVRVPM